MRSTIQALTMAVVFGTLAGLAPAGERIVSQSGLADGVFERGGYSIAPVRDLPSRQYSHDPGPTQVFEVLRPGQGPIRIGRLFTSCTCLELSTDQRDFGPGERAIFELRNVKPTVRGGATYTFFVQITEPVRETLRYDVFVDSSVPRAQVFPPQEPPRPPAIPPQAHSGPRQPLHPAASPSPGSPGASPWRQERPEESPSRDRPPALQTGPGPVRR